MKKLILIMLLIVASISYAQDRSYCRVCYDHSWFVSGGLDPKMTVQGPHGKGGTLNPELSFGIEWQYWRASMKYEWLSQIGYRKWTYFAIDYKAFSLLNDKLILMAGFETSVIYRDMEEPDFTDPDNYKDVETNLSAGINLEANYWLSDHIGVFANSNWFTAEAHDNFGEEMKKYRWDVKAGIIYKF